MKNAYMFLGHGISLAASAFGTAKLTIDSDVFETDGPDCSPSITVFGGDAGQITIINGARFHNHPGTALLLLNTAKATIDDAVFTKEYPAGYQFERDTLHAKDHATLLVKNASITAPNDDGDTGIVYASDGALSVIATNITGRCTRHEHTW